MAESKRYGVSTQLDIGQILLEARNRWLRPAEICEVLRNYQQFRIAPGPPNKPPSGSLFLFDRKVLRYFRKDGHNWRKKKDGKTVKEAHERLKAGSVDVVHCYYAHGEDNENFQRRSYWMLEEEFEHIVLVHYREVKGNKLSFVHTRDTNETLQNSQISSPVHSTSLHTNQSKVFSQALDTSSLNSAQTSEYEDAESDNHQANSRYHPLLELQQSDESSVTNHVDFGLLKTNFQSNQCDYGNHLTVPGVDFVSLGQGNTSENNSAGFQINFHESNRQMDMPPWADAFGECTMGFQTTALRPYLSSDQAVSMEGMPNKQVNLILEQLFTDDLYIKQEAAATPDTQAEWQIASEKDSSNVSTWPMDQKLPTESAYELSPSFQEHKDQQITESSFLESGQKNDFLMQIKDTLLTEVGCLETSNLDAVDGFNIKDRANSPCTPKRSLLDCSSTEEGLKKFDSFSRWMSKELGDADESLLTSSSGIYWETIESGNMAEDSNMSHQVHLDVDLLSPSLSQDQLFSILDFSPNWAYSGSETKVLITGTFLRNQKDVEKCKWSCMFGEVEAPAEILAPGVLRCHAPPYTPGRIPFYITCSNRLACSEIREFEYRFSHNSSVDAPDLWAGSTDEMLLHLRLGKLLSARSNADPKTSASSFDEKPNIRKKISSLLNENDDIWLQMVKLTREKDFSLGKVKDQLLQKLLKEKLHSWLLLKVVEDGKGPNILDKEGQGVLHLACALGYDWAIAPTIAAGVNINFRDMHGWTALHWAAFCGRERTVAALVSLGGESGALTDPTPEFPSGRTPADLASSNGHKGIAGYLAESSLTRHLSSLTLKEASRDSDLSVVSGEKSVEVSAEQSECNGGDVQDGLSLKDSLTAVRNAAQAAARIHEVFRVQSFHRKQLIEYGDDKFGISDEQALSLISVQKPHRSGQHNEPVHTAAIRIQNKFRGWKGRKEFLIIRQRIVKIQAHVRGHQVRKHYRKIVWSVGIVDKAILRWRRKGCGLRGFRPEGLIESSVMQCGPSNEDDYDFLKEGRKQTEARMEKALARVKSMVQYPEARDQYRRLLTVVTELQETKVGSEDDVIELQVEEEDQIFMSTS